MGTDYTIAISVCTVTPSVRVQGLMAGLASISACISGLVYIVVNPASTRDARSYEEEPFVCGGAATSRVKVVEPRIGIEAPAAVGLLQDGTAVLAGELNG